jgi:DNA polymerase-3 subunit beta
LVAGLSIVTRALATRSTLQILEGVLLETCPEGLRLTCTDLALGIETLVEAEVAEEGRVVMPGRLFSEIIRKLPDGVVEVTVNENHSAVIRREKSRTTLAGMNAMEFPELPEVEGGNLIAVPQAALRNLIQKTCFAIATDESRPLLTGCLMEIESEEIRLVALDGFRLALRKLPHAQSIEPMQAVIPGKVLSELAKVLADEESEVQLNIGRAYLSADMGVTRVVARLLEGEYTRYRRILPTEWHTKVKVNRGTFEKALDLAGLMAREGKNNLVRFHIADQQLTMTSNAEQGDVLEQVDLMVDGKDLEIAFNVRYMSDVLKALDEDEICLRFNSNVSPCEICPVEGDEYLYLVLPVRVI